VDPQHRTPHRPPATVAQTAAGASRETWDAAAVRGTAGAQDPGWRTGEVPETEDGPGDWDASGAVRGTLDEEVYRWGREACSFLRL